MLMPCWTVLLTSRALASHKEVLLGKPKRFNAFHNWFALPMRSIYFLNNLLSY